jgi:SepF-like predicted cell division protein (DUF552 family)
MSAQEKNTVVLSLDEYNHLRDFEKAIEEGNTVEIYSNFYINVNHCGERQSGYSTKLRLYSTDEVVKKIAEENAVLVSKLAELEEKNEPKEKAISEIKRMSVSEFRRWRRQ